MGRVIAFVNEKGGVGKTTSVLECAYQAGASGKSVLVVDLDPQSNATRMLLGSMKEDSLPEKGIYDLFIDQRGTIKLGSVVQSAIEAWPNTLVLPSDVRLGTIEPHLSNRLNREGILKSILGPIRDKFDFIFLDLGPAMNVLTLNALVAADSYLVPTDLSKYSQTGMRTVHNVAGMVRSSGNNPTLKLLGVFVSGFHKGIAHSVRNLMQEFSDEYEGSFLPVRIPHSVTVTDSQGQGKPVGLLAPESPVARAYTDLFSVVGGAVQ